MRSKIKYGKILLVVLITLLIWVWADKAEDKEDDFFGARIRPDLSAAQGLWVTFDGETDISLKSLTLRGPADKIDKLQTRWRKGDFEEGFFLSAEQVGLSGPGKKEFDVAEALDTSGQIRDLGPGLTAEGSEPDTLTVKVSKLVERSLSVKCVDSSGNVLWPESVDPENVNMLVPEDWGPEMLVAEVELRVDDIKQAQIREVELPAKIKLTEKDERVAKPLVKIKMEADQDDQIAYLVSGATLGYVFSANLQGAYKVELLNPHDLDTVSIRATSKAKDTYQRQKYQMLLFIYDGDEKKKDPLMREVVYYWPEEFVGKDEIELSQDQEPTTAKFKLKPIEKD